MAARDAHLQHLPALDGLRGCAVAVVVAFHAGRLTGGWLGVDVFFVLSGYLITRLLLVESATFGAIDLKRFWGRRARRLLPAMLITVAVVAVAERARHRLTGPAGARWDVIGALTYSSNWMRLRAGAGYWSQFGPPSLLEHFWSLAIEEQFYVVWPMVMIGLTRLRRSVVTGLLAAATVAGAVWSLVLFGQTSDASRVYMGTDTRVYALLVGATVASLGEWRPSWLRPARWLAPAAAGVLIVGCVALDGTRLVTYRGGLVGCTLAAAVVVAGLATGPGRFAGVLAVPPLRWLGARSYGIYLWHWPVFAGLGIAGRSNASLGRVAAGVVASLAVAEVSYRYVEMPIRRRGLAVVPWRAALPVAGAALAIVAMVVVSVPDGRSWTQAATVVPSTGQRAPIPTSAAAVANGQPTADDGQPTTVVSNPTGDAAPAFLSRPTERPLRVLIVGDSVGWNLGEQMVADQVVDDLEVRNIAVAACPPSYTAISRRRDSGSVPLEFGNECADQVAAYPFVVNDFQPDVSFVVFGASFVDQNLIAPDVWSSPCEPAFDEWHRSTMTQIAAALGAKGGRVVIVSQAYYRGEVTGRTPVYDGQTDCQNRVIREIAEADPRMGYIDLGAWTCPTRECLVERDGIELRVDGTHFLGAAARLVNSWLLDQALTMPSGVQG